MPVAARSPVRKMRGGAQAHLMECDDGAFYVVKFRNNPQHRRILVNEWLGSAFLDYLQIAAPKAEIVRVTAEFLETNPEVAISHGPKKVAVEPGWHFGSKYPGDPARLAVYDFLPDTLLEKVANIGDFLGALAFDKWMGNADARQSIFFRARLREWTAAQGEHPLRVGFVAQMVDHGYVFDGPRWSFTDSPLQGLYFRAPVYRDAVSAANFEPWLDRILHFPEQVVDRAWKRIPADWFEGDERALEGLLEKLLARRKRVPDLVREAVRGRSKLFANWR